MLTACVPRCVPRVSIRLKPPRPRLGGIHARKSRPVVSAAVVQASSRSGSSSRTSWHPPPFRASSRIPAGLRGVAFSRRGVRPSSVRGVSRSRSLSANLNSSRVQPSASARSNQCRSTSRPSCGCFPPPTGSRFSGSIGVAPASPGSTPYSSAITTSRSEGSDCERSRRRRAPLCGLSSRTCWPRRSRRRYRRARIGTRRPACSETWALIG